MVNTGLVCVLTHTHALAVVKEFDISEITVEGLRTTISQIRKEKVVVGALKCLNVYVILLEMSCCAKCSEDNWKSFPLWRHFYQQYQVPPSEETQAAFMQVQAQLPHCSSITQVQKSAPVGFVQNPSRGSV